VIGAAVDVGSNSVHLLVARIGADGLEYLRDESELLGLGEIVDTLGEIPEDAQSLLLHSLQTYRDAALLQGAEQVTFLGTEPLRRAANGPAVAARVKAETGVALHILPEREEGELTFLGVTGGEPVGRPLVVVDIGGGSSEVILYDPERGLEVTGLATGSNRLSIEIVDNDPPTKREVARLRERARELVAALPQAKAERAIFVGGTATNIVKLRPLATSSFDNLFVDIRSAPAAALAARFGLRLRRSLQLAAGAALAEAILEHYALGRAEVCDASLRDGAIILVARASTGRAASSG
jgi:exopolyphosphatase/guanosine-5'-triphosphate,3'-diphosphate pyrophosphatase